MADTPEVILQAYCDGQQYCFVRQNVLNQSTYGGPLERKIVGMPFGPHRLHQVAELSGGSIPRLSSLYGFDLPLLYGFRFDGCLLKYRFARNEIEVLEIRPETSSEHWPYHDYPAILPYVPIVALPPKPMSWEAFAQQFPNMADAQPAQLVAVAPPPFTLGFSMWGKSGDTSDVHVVFECDLDEKRVDSYNVCD